MPEAMPFLEVRVRLDGPEPSLRARIEAALEGKPVRLARIDTSSARREESTGEVTHSLDDLGQLDPLAIFTDAYSGKYGEAPPATLLAAFNEILNAPEDLVQ
jgi:exonuclease SbcD